MLLKILGVLTVVLSIPTMIGGYIYHLWDEDQQYWAEQRAAAEVRYAKSVEAKCQLGQIADNTKCGNVLDYLTASAASNSSGRQPKPPATIANAIPQTTALLGQRAQLLPADFDRSKVRSSRVSGRSLVMP